MLRKEKEEWKGSGESCGGGGGGGAASGATGRSPHTRLSHELVTPSTSLPLTRSQRKLSRGYNFGLYQVSIRQDHSPWKGNSPCVIVIVLVSVSVSEVH